MKRVKEANMDLDPVIKDTIRKIFGKWAIVGMEKDNSIAIRLVNQTLSFDHLKQLETALNAKSILVFPDAEQHQDYCECNNHGCDDPCHCYVTQALKIVVVI